MAAHELEAVLERQGASKGEGGVLPEREAGRDVCRRDDVRAVFLQLLECCQRCDVDRRLARRCRV